MLAWWLRAPLMSTHSIEASGLGGRYSCHSHCDRFFWLHNLIPSLTTYFHGNAGCTDMDHCHWQFHSPCIYLLWEWIILGIVPLQDFKTALDQGEIATEALKEAVGASWVVWCRPSFCFFCYRDFFSECFLELFDFLADGLKIKKSPFGK